MQVLAAASIMIAGAAEAKKKKPVPPPPPPPPAPKYVVVPWKPIPPEWAAPTTYVPPLGPDGLRVSVNRNITPAQTLWNLRSGYNVAALNCRDPKHAEIVVNYRAFLKAHAKTLRATNTKIDAEWRGKYGAGFIKSREKYMTEVYNHFAMPPTLPAFCDAALAMSRDGKLVKSAALNDFAARSLPSLEIVFDDFFKRFDAYKVEMAAWEAKWGKDTVPGSTVLESSVRFTN
ncbi:hypothetical protein C0V78_05450 [Novosphingobium sp. TH158]|nr:hypothetical protein C0V78_05450 [Novosphingobium sp. TH158]